MNRDRQEAWAIVPAGGSGSRFSATENKLLALLGGVPVLVRTLEALGNASLIDGILVAAHPEMVLIYSQLIEQHCLTKKPILWVKGGKTRRESVWNGLRGLPTCAQIVAVHDAARPLIEPGLVDQGITLVREQQVGVVIGVPIRDTVKQIGQGITQEITNAQGLSPEIYTTVDRSRLWRAQTPQIFQRDVLMRAHQAVSLEVEMTDDAQLVERANCARVCLLEGQERNLKITTPEDLLIAEALL